jgi:hypothetical protein
VVRLHHSRWLRATTRHKQSRNTDKRSQTLSPGLHAPTGLPATFLMSFLPAAAQHPLPRAASRELTMLGIKRRYFFHIMWHVPGLRPSSRLCARLPSLSRRAQNEHRATKAVWKQLLADFRRCFEYPSWLSSCRWTLHGQRPPWIRPITGVLTASLAMSRRWPATHRPPRPLAA